MTIGPFEPDLIARAIELLPADLVGVGERRNILSGAERPPDGEVRVATWFVTFQNGRGDIHADGEVRFLDFEFLLRFHRPTATAVQKEREAAEGAAHRLYDALHLSGGFIGAKTGGQYLDIRATSLPRLLEDRHMVFTVTAWLDG